MVRVGGMRLFFGGRLFFGASTLVQGRKNGRPKRFNLSGNEMFRARNFNSVPAYGKCNPCLFTYGLMKAVIEYRVKGDSVNFWLIAQSRCVNPSILICDGSAAAHPQTDT